MCELISRRPESSWANQLLESEQKTKILNNRPGGQPPRVRRQSDSDRLISTIMKWALGPRWIWYKREHASLCYRKFRALCDHLRPNSMIAFRFFAGKWLGNHSSVRLPVVIRCLWASNVAPRDTVLRWFFLLVLFLPSAFACPLCQFFLLVLFIGSFCPPICLMTPGLRLVDFWIFNSNSRLQRLHKKLFENFSN